MEHAMNAKAALESGAGRSALDAALSAAAWVLLAVATGVALLFTAMAVLVIGLLVLGAALAIQFAPRPRPATVANAFEARRTPAGWVVEFDSAPRS
jgi:hypothetical protein